MKCYLHKIFHFAFLSVFHISCFSLLLESAIRIQPPIQGGCTISLAINTQFTHAMGPVGETMANFSHFFVTKRLSVFYTFNRQCYRIVSGSLYNFSFVQVEKNEKASEKKRKEKKRLTGMVGGRLWFL